jgi:hypothetical protein
MGEIEAKDVCALWQARTYSGLQNTPWTNTLRMAAPLFRFLIC